MCCQNILERNVKHEKEYFNHSYFLRGLTGLVACGGNVKDSETQSESLELKMKLQSLMKLLS